MSESIKIRRFLEGQMSYQRHVHEKLRDTRPEISQDAEARAEQFEEVIAYIAKLEKRQHKANGQTTIDSSLLDYLLQCPNRSCSIPNLYEALASQGQALTKPVLMLRVSELVKHGKAWRLGDTIGLPNG